VLNTFWLFNDKFPSPNAGRVSLADCRKVWVCETDCKRCNCATEVDNADICCVNAAIDSGFSASRVIDVEDKAMGRERLTISCNILTWAEREEMADSVAASREDRAMYIGCFDHSSPVPLALPPVPT